MGLAKQRPRRPWTVQRLPVWAALSLLATILSAQAPALGPEFRVNTHTSGRERGPKVAIDPSGNFVIVWFSDGQDGDTDGVFGQRYDATGTAQGGEFQVNTYTTGAQDSPSVGMTAAGGFVVTWISAGQDGNGKGIFAQRFDAAGTPQGSEFQVNTYTTGDQSGPIVGVDGSGNFVIVWESDGQDGSGWGIFGRRYDASGTPQGGEFQVNTYTTGDQLYPIVSTNAAGNFVVTWQSPQDGAGTGIVARRYNASGTPQGGEIPVNAFTTGNQKAPWIAIDPTNAFVVAWASDAQDGSGYGVLGRRFDASGNPLGNEFPANTFTAGSQSQTNVGVDATGNFLITWASPQDGSSLGIYGRTFDSSAVAHGPEFQINTYTTNSQSYGKLAMNANGNFVVAWTSYGEDGAYEGVYARRGDMHAAQPYVVDAHGSGSTSNLNGVLEPGETVVVEPSWKNTTTAPLTFTGTASNLTGPGGPTYSIPDSTADYGTVAPGATANCYDATAAHDCYLMTVSGARPVAHWDATFTESLTDGLGKTWTMHVGNSFTDVPTSQQFYKFIETIFHNGITGGCGAGTYCPTNSVTRAQMAVFLLKSAHGSSFVPPPCTGIFADVACPSLFADWIEELSAEGITGGCGGANYCPDNPVTRAQMAVFLLKASHGSSYTPPACTGIFTDVACPSQFANWIEQLFNEGITGGCGPGVYCPDSPNNRGQMAVFLSKTFGLQLYGP